MWDRLIKYGTTCWGSHGSGDRIQTQTHQLPHLGFGQGTRLLPESFSPGTQSTWHWSPDLGTSFFISAKEEWCLVNSPDGPCSDWCLPRAPSTHYASAQKVCFLRGLGSWSAHDGTADRSTLPPSFSGLALPRPPGEERTEM